jgi:hypothetical protein
MFSNFSLKIVPRLEDNVENMAETDRPQMKM